MKRWLAVLAFAVFLSGCAALSRDPDRAMALRGSLLKGEEIRFRCDITADYGDKLHTFSMDCRGDNAGQLQFTVTEPESISGVSGRIGGGQGSLDFDGQALAFPLIADELMSPVSAPWVVISALRSGTITSGGKSGDSYQITISYPFEDENLRVDAWLDGENHPVRGEILKDGRRYLTVDMKDFQIL